MAYIHSNWSDPPSSPGKMMVGRRLPFLLGRQLFRGKLTVKLQVETPKKKALFPPNYAPQRKTSKVKEISHFHTNGVMNWGDVVVFFWVDALQCAE